MLQLVSAAVKCFLPETLPVQNRKDGSLSGLREVMAGLWASYKRLLDDPRQIVSPCACRPNRPCHHTSAQFGRRCSQ